MIFYPKAYVKNVTYITKEFLIENGIKGIILDVDYTLLNYEEQILDGAVQWAEEMKKQGFRTNHCFQ